MLHCIRTSMKEIRILMASKAVKISLSSTMVPIVLGTNIVSWSFTDGSASVNSSTPGANLIFRIVAVGGDISQWDIWTEVQPSGAGWPIFFNTTSDAYDWSQHSDGSYGGNWDSSGSWVAVSPTSDVPEISTYLMMMWVLVA
jgi:hypothetical protein